MSSACNSTRIYSHCSGHSEQTISAAIGHVVNVLRCLSWILDYPLRYPVLFGGSNSFVGDPKEDKMYVLHVLSTDFCIRLSQHEKSLEIYSNYFMKQLTFFVRYPLFGMRSRVERDRLDTSLCLINRNIAQLRYTYAYLPSLCIKTGGMFRVWEIISFPGPIVVLQALDISRPQMAIRLCPITTGDILFRD